MVQQQERTSKNKNAYINLFEEHLEEYREIYSTFMVFNFSILSIHSFFCYLAS